LSNFVHIQKDRQTNQQSKNIISFGGSKYFHSVAKLLYKQ